MADVEPKTSSPEDLISTKDDAKTSTRAASTESAEGSISAPSPPRIDGGSKAWLTLAGTFIALFCAFGQMSAFGTFQTYYADHQLRDLPASTISWIGSVAFWMFFFSVRSSLPQSAVGVPLTCNPSCRAGSSAACLTLLALGSSCFLGAYFFASPL